MNRYLPLIFLFMGLFLLSVYYVGRRLYQTLRYFIPGLRRRSFIGGYFLLTLSFFAGRLASPVFLQRFFAALSAYWMGLFLYLFMMYILADLTGGLYRLARRSSSERTRGLRTIATFLAIILVIYGLWNATRIVDITYDIPLDQSLDHDLTISLIADLHLGDMGSEQRVEEIVERINQSSPDLVVIAGDIFSDNYHNVKDPDKLEALFQSIESRYGVYAALGNHDGGRTLPDMISFLERSDIHVLHEDYEVINDMFVLVGRLDGSPIGGYGDMERGSTEQLFQRVPDHLPIIVIEHTPVDLEAYNQRADVVLSGHTHRGQMFPANLVTKLIFTVDYGHYQEAPNDPHIIVTQGAGTWMMPRRLGTNNEVVTIRLRGR